MARRERQKLIEAIEKHRASHLICCVTSDRQNANGMMAKDLIPIFFNHLTGFQDHGSIDVFLFTLGGDTLAAFGLSRLLREFTSKVGVLIPEKCQSAGTLFALGANQVFMTRAATLSPIDPSISGPLNPVIEIAPGQRQIVPVSVESVAGYKALVREDWKLDPENTGTAFKILAEKVNPLSLGDVYRSQKQIARLARELMGSHRRDKKNIQSIIDTLTRELGSHDYLIFRNEARNLLGEQIAKDDIALEVLVWELYEDFAADMELGKAYEPGIALHAATAAGQSIPTTIIQKKVIIESSSGSDVVEIEISLSPIQAGPVPQTLQQVVRAGWKHYL